VILAIVRGEAGEEKALRLSRDAVISAVNVAEVVTKCIEKAYPVEVALQVIQSAGIKTIDFDYDLAVTAGRLQSLAPKGVLSLGDRACIATAIKIGGTAVTADRVWSTLDLGCKVELIR
jgi:PIN domain nuclease of toxin-antitoxin system